MKNKTRSILITVTVIFVAVLGALIIRGASNKPVTPDMTEPSANAQKVVYNDDTPDFTFTPKKDSEFSSREDVYKEYYRLKKEFFEFKAPYEESWTEKKSDKNHDIYGEYLNGIYNLLEDKFRKKSDSDILSEKTELIEFELSNLSDRYVFAWESAELASDKSVRETYKNLADENELKYREAVEYYEEYKEGKHTVDDVLSYLGIAYDETENPRYIPPEYYYN